uniref:DUF4371 domain-containing protein n=1 Tax=Latimeria chalumnae TaxID=7897 RepID=H3AUE8_LATCH
CTCCSQDISIAAAGWNDISKHLKTDKRKNEKAKSSTVPIFSLLKKETYAVTKAECFVEFLIEHNLLLSVADHATPLFKAMFADSKIAKDFSCRRTKTSHIIHTLPENSKSELVSVLKCRPFCLATDGSNDIEDCTLYPIVVRVFNHNEVKTCLLSLPELKKDSAAVNIYDCIRCQLETLGIPWCNMIAFTSDNALVMLGQNSGVGTLLKQVHSSVHTIGCPCHLIHITANKAADTLPISVEDIVITIYYYLKKRSKRKKFQELYSVEFQKIIKHVHTRWLSLGKSLKRILLHWDALHEVFKSEVSNKRSSKNMKRLCHVFGDLNTKLYFLFLDALPPIFEDTNKVLSSDESLIHVLHEMLLKFVKPDILRSSDLLQVPFEEECNHKTSDMIIIGHSAEQYIKDNRPQLYLAKFFKCAVSFYVTAFQYMKKFPYNDPVLLHAEVANIKRHEQVPFQSVEYFVNRFPTLLPTCENTPEQVDELQNEFLLYQVDSEIDTMSVHQIDHAKKYKVLSDIMLGILVILHSNADCECVFSIVTKNQTVYLLDKKTFQHVGTKRNHGMCYEQKPSEDLLKAVKKATYAALHDNSIQ